MKPVNIVLLAAAFAVAGTWVKDKTIQPSMVVGGAFLSLSVVVMEGSAPKLAQQFSWLILAATVGAYGEDVFSMVGKITTGKNDQSSQASSDTSGQMARNATTGDRATIGKLAVK
jgi:hypothetical protein